MYDKIHYKLKKKSEKKANRQKTALFHLVPFSKPVFSEISQVPSENSSVLEVLGCLSFGSLCHSESFLQCKSFPMEVFFCLFFASGREAFCNLSMCVRGFSLETYSPTPFCILPFEGLYGA